MTLRVTVFVSTILVQSITCLYLQIYWLLVVPLVCIRVPFLKGCLQFTSAHGRWIYLDSRPRLVSPIYLDSRQVKRDTEIPIEKRKTFVLISRIGLETNTYPMIHKIWSDDSFYIPDACHYTQSHGIISFFHAQWILIFTDIIKYIILQ